MGADLRTLAALRLDEAKSLVANGFSSGAYYLCGYSVECGLKAVIVKSWQLMFASYGLPGKNEVIDTYVHNLTKLVNVANLSTALTTEATANPNFRDYWEVVKDWNESSRYEVWTPQEAQDIILAVDDPDDGVMRWLRPHW